TDPPFGYPPPVSRSMPAADAIASLVSRLDYPLFVVTVSSSEERSGCLVGFVTQCSIQPPRYLVCISKENHTFDVSRKATALALHLLGRDQHHVASVFGEETGDDVDKFAQVSWTDGVTGSPVLSECAAWMEGAIIDRVDVGDHVACLVDPVAGGLGSHDGQFTLSDAGDLEPGHPESSD
ncbi:MAG TPA: flavin reductase family protein, partial [Acidimicrobiales bacterium]|nr:flavin reductase family protein [Acidimicrobiales bacterium]